MSRKPGTTDREYATVNVSEEFRDKLRVEKAKRGVSYEELIRQNLTLDLDG